MKNILLQLVLLVVLFFALWLGLSKIDWMELLNVNYLTSKTQLKLGELILDQIKNSGEEYHNPKVTLPLDSILTAICISNAIDRSQVQLHVIKSEEVNAFALPNHQLVIYSGLILETRNEAELSGVICHEIAHMELDHVMKKLIKEVGISVLISTTTGNSGSNLMVNILKTLSSTAYDRDLEGDADIRAVDYLLRANIDPIPFARFLRRIPESKSAIDQHLTWMSTHPDAEERAAYIIEFVGEAHGEYQPILSPVTWQNLQHQLK
ncbi:MAG: peptidase M48 [Bacteroidetes bacterium CG18_big_fil_WC_8_21_14_2_50_41_14]|nr:MAG: peptidase M48 [Bacteroidetes bacterium CG18_big_fil_WC_8_21_14_2_50_41_14]PJB56873.1 MAG: peptidase M48 [Bacteroidetes bacterium CG_4_9_14_3_um_filter_41_19]